MTLEHVQGDTFVQDLAFTDDDTGAPINLTGASIVFSMKKCKDDVTYIVQQSATIVNASGGLAKILINPFDYDIGEYYFDIQMVDSGSIKTTPVRGMINIVYEITKN